MIKITSRKAFCVALMVILGRTVITVGGQSGYSETTSDQTNEGNEFFVGFFRNRFGREFESEVVSPVLWITTTEPTQINFEVFTIEGLLASDVAVAGQITYLHIPLGYVVFNSSENSMTDSQFKGIYIKAQGDSKIVVFGQNEEAASNDAYLALPIILLPSGRYEYIAASVRDYGSYIDSVALIIGTENDTEIIVEPSVLIPHPLAPSQTDGNFIPGAPVEFRTVTIQRFQTFYLQVRNEDISGTRIMANKPISIFSGHECADIPQSSAPCDMLIEQIQPIDTWGTEVVTIPLRTRSADVIKVFASQDSTIVSVTRTNINDGTVISDPSFTLDRNQFRELVIGDFTLIESNYQIGVFQFSRSFTTDNVIMSDPFMLSVPSREQYRNSYVVAPAPFDPSIEGSTEGRVAYVNYTNIAIPAEYFNLSLITINNNTINASEFKLIRRADNSIWGYGAQSLLDEGAQLINHQDPNAALSVTIYGFSNQMSWGCTGGIGLALVTLDFISSITVIALDPQVVGQLLIVDCSSDVSNVSSTENHVVGQSLILRCSINTIGPVIETVTFLWSSNNTTLRMTNEVGQTRDYYVISQLNTSNDGQKYMCEVIINTTLPVNVSDTILLDLDVPTFSVIVTPFSLLQGVAVGDSQDIQCTAEVTFNGVESSAVIFQWLGPEGIAIENDSRVTISPTNCFGNTFNSTLHFLYLMEGDDGMYTCNVMILRANESVSTELGRLNIPTPNVSVSAYNTVIMVVGQPFVLECVVNAVRGTTSQVAIVWSNVNSNEELRKVNVNASAAIFGSVVYRDYLNMPHLTTNNNNVTYQCEVMINDAMASDRLTLYVTVPNFTVEMSPAGLVQGGVVGNKQTIHCIINTVDGVTPNSLIVDWIGPRGTPVTSNSRITISPPTIGSGNNSINHFTSSLDFMYLMEDDEGRYVCNVSILQTGASMMVQIGALTIPIPIVSIEVETNQTAGQPLTLDCTVIAVRGITSRVDITWLVNDVELETIRNVDLSSPTDDETQLYMDSYTIDRLSVNDNENVYQCEVLIDSDPLVMATDNFTLNVTGILIDNTSGSSNTSWIIIIVSVGVMMLITIMAITLCLIILRKRTVNQKTLTMNKAELNPYGLNNTNKSTTLKSLDAVSMQNLVDEWKKELAAYLIDYNSLDIKDSIASGKFGVVYRGLYTTKENNIIEVAVKTVKYFSSSTADNFIKECNIANKFDHPNVLSLIGVCIIPEESVPLMVMPYMHHGDVRSFVKSRRADNIKVDDFPLDLGEEVLTKMCLDIAKGMEYLAVKHFVHRDLAARNCMLNQSMTVKVADFGLSRDVYVTEYYTMSHSIPLPVKWLAPEALFDRHFSEKTDVWAFGVTCWEVFSLGLQPYPLIGPSEIGDYIKSGNVLDKPQLSSDEMYKIMSSCWKFKPDERPDFKEIIKRIDHLEVAPPNQSATLSKKTSAAYLPVYS